MLSLTSLWKLMTCFLLQPMLQELGKQNPHLMRLIQEHQADFLRLINEPVEGGEGWDNVVVLQFALVLIDLYCKWHSFGYICVSSNLLGQLGSATPQSVIVTPEERESIERVCIFYALILILNVFIIVIRIITSVYISRINLWNNSDEKGLGIPGFQQRNFMVELLLLTLFSHYWFTIAVGYGPYGLWRLSNKGT